MTVQIRRAILALGLVVCVLILAAWGISMWLPGGFIAGSYGVALESGCLVGWTTIHPMNTYGWVRGSLLEGRGLLPYLDRRLYYSVLAIPLWIPLLTVVVPTVILWRRSQPD